VTVTKGIRGWPANERPRERLLTGGPHSLTDSELLAVILRTGARGMTAVDLGRDTLKKYGSLRALSRRDAGELAQGDGFGPAKAAAVASAFELGRRAAAENEEPHPRFRSSADVAAHFLPLTRGLKREVFRVLMLDSAHRIMGTRTITVGTLNLAVVHPREAFREAIIEGAAALVLMHNHPSGDPTPSEEDVRLTRQFVRAGEDLGIPVLDHVVLGEGRHYSFADSKRMGG
jgi:DNA repair protein RadC